METYLSDGPSRGMQDGLEKEEEARYLKTASLKATGIRGKGKRTD